MTTPGTLAVVGGGWAGLAAAVEATRRGHAVTLFEMASRLGGRARAVADPAGTLDNGQHILIGAYTATLGLMRSVGVDIDAVLLRTPLALVGADGVGLRLPAGHPTLAFARGVWRHAGWRRRERLALLATASGWWATRFRCDPRSTVAELTASLPAAVRADLIEPLCVAALNTHADAASATVFLRVLRDALGAGAGSADLLLPRASLDELLPAPAAAWLDAAGARLRLGTRVERLRLTSAGWRLDDADFDRVVLAASPAETARLVSRLAPAWAETTLALRHEPIATLYAHSVGTRLPEPMLALAAGDAAPAQFVFDRGRLGGPEGLLAFVVSGAQRWVDAGRDALVEATLRQADDVLRPHLHGPLEVVRLITEKRATFRCTPGLARAALRIADGLHAAGDHVDGPYPATLEGAVRSGIDAVRTFD